MTQLLENPYEMRAEIWREYPFNEKYSVSNLGNVKSKKKALKYCDNDHFNIKINGCYKERTPKSLVRETFCIIESEFENEIWKDIEGLYGYRISNFGRIKSMKKNYEIILKQYKRPLGYMSIHIEKSGIKKDYSVHRLVAKQFIPNTDSCKNVINHINGNPSDNRVENLEWVTSRENSHHGKSTKNTACLHQLKGTDEYRVYIYYKGKSVYLGRYKLEEGIKVRDNFFKERSITNKYL